ncbi:hypothetical protein COCON_G00087810 [Conger conger]|uniref:Uncharacterized protein n=1 Tax=Conger conger TaxID=82655 RepID=A0A9Q1DL82_CONCO|nr:hypothetical protein COCON_G00087810 [Conger conger]
MSPSSSPPPPAAATRLLWGLLLLLALCNRGAPQISPRTTVRFHEDHIRQFREEGIQNYSTMLLQEDLGLLLVGAREAVFALDLTDISNMKASVDWKVSKADEEECTNKGKQADTECQNYIRVLQEMADGRVYVCGTNAYSPTCGHLKYTDGKLTMEEPLEDGKGKCPFDPFQRYSSVMVDGSLYSATSNNFLGSEPVVMRSLSHPVRTEFKISWLNEPSFISMFHVPESEDSPTEDDDKVYLFFSETAVEYDYYSKLTVSRVARVCKGDIGGQRTLQKKWTSFLKARLDCPVLDSRLPHVVQDVFLLRHDDWRESIYYAVFTPQQGPVDHSAVCAYKVSDIGDVFARGKFKTPVTVATSFVKWVMYSDDLPEPRPGACIDLWCAECGGVTVGGHEDSPLMDQGVRPIRPCASSRQPADGPQLVERGAAFTRIVVDQVERSTERPTASCSSGRNGFLHKAVNYDGEMVVIEAVQLFETEEPIKILRLSSSKVVPQAVLYAGSDSGVVQMNLSDCGRHASCMDCVLSRDPYCAWDTPTSRCVAVYNLASPHSGEQIQSLKDGDASLCPASDPNTVRRVNVTMYLGSNVNLPCRAQTDLAQVRWQLSGAALPASPRYRTYREGLMVLDAVAGDAGVYTCLSEERVKGSLYTRAEVEYRVSEGAVTPRIGAQTQGGSGAFLQVAVALLSLLLVALLAWNVYKGHIPLPFLGPCGEGPSERRDVPSQDPAPASRPEANCLEDKPLMPAVNYSSNNNNRLSANTANGEAAPTPKVTVDAFQFIDDESEI